VWPVARSESRYIRRLGPRIAGLWWV